MINISVVDGGVRSELKKGYMQIITSWVHEVKFHLLQYFVNHLENPLMCFFTWALALSVCSLKRWAWTPVQIWGTCNLQQLMVMMEAHSCWSGEKPFQLHYMILTLLSMWYTEHLTVIVHITAKGWQTCRIQKCKKKNVIHFCGYGEHSFLWEYELWLN